jgi:hypothetical protein
MTTIEDVMGRALAYAMDDTGERGTREQLLAAVKQYAAERVAEATAEWNKLRDPVTLHVSLLRGFPAQLDRATFLHIAGDEPPNVADKRQP